jgi:DNA-binding CsgD family transcriptional regulator
MRFYQQIFKPHNIRHSLAISMPAGDNFFATLVMFRSAAEGQFDIHEESVAEKLLPFLRGGLERASLSEKHNRLGWLLGQVGGDLSYQEIAVIDRHLDVVCVHPEPSARLQALLHSIQRRHGQASATAPDLQPACRRMLATEGDTPARVAVTFLDADHWGQRVTLILRKVRYGKEDVLSLFLCAPNDDPRPTGLAAEKPLLTPQEKLVAAYVAQGATNAEIADQLGIAASTAAHHVSAVLRKSGLESRWQLQAAEGIAERIALLPLSHRQRQVLEARMAGLSTAETAAKFSIGEVTVRNHLRAIYRVLGVSGFRGLVSRLKS